MSKQWKEVWHKAFDSNKNESYLDVVVLYNKQENVALIKGFSYKYTPTNLTTLYTSYAGHYAVAEYDKFSTIVEDYTQAIEWGRELAEQWRVRFNLDQAAQSSNH